MRIYPAIHYTMGGLWVDYNLMSNVPGPARARRGELLRSRRQPPRRERADAGAGRRLLRHPLHDRRLPGEQRRCRRSRPITTRSRRRPTTRRSRSTSCSSVKGHRGIREIHRELGRIMWDDVGMARTEASLTRALERDSEAARGVLAQRVGARHARQPESEPRVRRPRRRLPRVRRTARARRARTRANRAAAISARRARRPTARRCATTSTSRTWRRGSSRASASEPELHKEPLEFEEVHPTQRSYK